MQRGGTYSVVPRVPGGELSPDQLIQMGMTAKKYNLYSKVTGAQRIDFFGASKYQLPDIWEELGSAGLESGHAYGKALRTVKSCVGSTWCRFGVASRPELMALVRTDADPTSVDSFEKILHKHGHGVSSITSDPCFLTVAF